MNTYEVTAEPEEEVLTAEQIAEMNRFHENHRQRTMGQTRSDVEEYVRLFTSSINNSERQLKRVIRERFEGDMILKHIQTEDERIRRLLLDFSHVGKDYFITRYLHYCGLGEIDTGTCWSFAHNDLEGEIGPMGYEDWLYKLTMFLCKVKKDLPEKPKKPENLKPEEIYNLDLRFHFITLTLPADLPHDEGIEYLREYVETYFTGLRRKGKQKAVIPTHWWIEIGDHNNLHDHMLVDSKKRLNTGSYPLREYKYNANIRWPKTANHILNIFNYDNKDKKNVEYFPNEIVKTDFRKILRV